MGEIARLAVPVAPPLNHELRRGVQLGCLEPVESTASNAHELVEDGALHFDRARLPILAGLVAPLT